MRNARLNLLVVIAAFAASFSFYGCLKPEVFPDEPIIEFKEYQLVNDDSLMLSFSFTDGDGDIGLGSADIAPPFDTSSKYYNNVFLRYYEKVNGNWVQGVNAQGDPVEFRYRTEKLTPTGKNKALKGRVIIYITPIYYNAFSPDGDTIKYDIQLVDRALHESNLVESGEIYP
ncbi:MAG TPA: hypothetical protein VK177_06060 [Flavobacteriales bacterium]|nr:hypothetical protein [Flavobacteriales bacterium]